jgi:hypothetical protein
MQAEQASLETKNQDLNDAFREKTKAQQQLQKLYQSLKSQFMSSQVAAAAGEEVEMTSRTARGDQFIDRLPGTRTGTTNYNRTGVGNPSGRPRQHGRVGSGSSGSSGQQRGGIGLPPTFASHLQGRVYTGRM